MSDAWHDALPDLEVLPITPLDDAAAERLLRAYLGGAELDPATREVLLARAQGNPFFLAELLHLLVDRGLLRRSGDGWRLAGTLPREFLPAGVQAVLAARIDTLDPLAKAILRDAAVAGARFTADMVKALAPHLDDAAIADGIQMLSARGIVRVAGGDPGGHYVFSHALALDVAYAGIPKGERARRHAQLALWAPQQMRGTNGEVDAFVASQAEQAVGLATEMRLPPADPSWRARAVGAQALVRLGQAALARDDNTRAETLFSRALELGDDDAALAAIDARIGRAAARVSLHRLDEAAADLAADLDSANLGRRAAALVVSGDIRRRRGDLTGATEALVSALVAASEAGIDRVTSEALRQLGMIEYRSGRLGAAEEHFREALGLAQRVGDRRGAGWALQHLAWSATTRGDYDRAEQMLGEAAEVFNSLDDEGGLSWCAGTEAFVRLLQGRLHAARTLARGLLAVGTAAGEHWGTAVCWTIDAYAAAELGEVTVALDETTAALEVFTELSDSWGRSFAAVARGVALRAAGRRDEAVELLEESVQISVASGQPASGALALSTLGYCWLDEGKLDQAEDAARQAMALVTGLELRPAALIGPRVLLAQVLRARGRVEEAVPLLEEAALAPDQGSLMFPRRQALAHLAGARLEFGRVDEALRTAQRALAVPAEDVRSRVIALRVLAQCLARAGDAPAAHYAARQAMALAAATELVSERAATERLLTPH
jgi:tetratricopeptide (TPR) repeat protein